MLNYFSNYLFEISKKLKVLVKKSSLSKKKLYKPATAPVCTNFEEPATLKKSDEGNFQEVWDKYIQSMEVVKPLFIKSYKGSRKSYKLFQKIVSNPSVVYGISLLPKDEQESFLLSLYLI